MKNSTDCPELLQDVQISCPARGPPASSVTASLLGYHAECPQAWHAARKAGASVCHSSNGVVQDTLQA